LAVIELKNASDENATIRCAFKQIETYNATIPSLFTTKAICVVSDGLDAKAGSISAGYPPDMQLLATETVLRNSSKTTSIFASGKTLLA
jgi:type I site-specific restriction-modification system R (restriction) subunit